MPNNEYIDKVVKRWEGVVDTCTGIGHRKRIVLSVVCENLYRDSRIPYEDFTENFQMAERVYNLLESVGKTVRYMLAPVAFSHDGTEVIEVKRFKLSDTLSTLHPLKPTIYLYTVNCQKDYIRFGEGY